MLYVIGCPALAEPKLTIGKYTFSQECFNLLGQNLFKHFHHIIQQTQMSV